MTKRSLQRALTTAVAAIAMAPAPAAADVDFGVRGGFYDDADAGFVGFELLTALSGQWFLNPNLEYVFVDEGSLWTLNGDVHYDLPTRSDFAVWLGGGPAVIFQEIDPPRNCPRCEGVDETDFGLNLLGGIGMKRGGIRPYAQGKVILSDDTEAVLAVGLRFH
jgi:hypothetical protein